MGLLDKPFLGNGYHIYFDDFYTSPQLFRHLSSLHFGDPVHIERGGGRPLNPLWMPFPKRPRGSMRGIRDDDLLFVNWMDTREVSICSTIHQAYTSDKVMRRWKKRDGTLEKISIAVPTPVVEYNKHIRGVDLNDPIPSNTPLLTTTWWGGIRQCSYTLWTHATASSSTKNWIEQKTN